MAKASDAFIEKHAARMADRQAEISDKALDAIDEAIEKFRVDLKATKPVRQADGTITEGPAFLMTPRDLCLLIDRFQVLFDRPSRISEDHGTRVSPEMSPGYPPPVHRGHPWSGRLAGLTDTAVATPPGRLSDTGVGGRGSTPTHRHAAGPSGP